MEISFNDEIRAFIEQNCSSGLITHFDSVLHVTEEGHKHNYSTIYCPFGAGEYKKTTPLIDSLLFFNLLDISIDSISHISEDINFYDKYKRGISTHSDNPFFLCVYEIYRIFLVIRSTLVHHNDGFSRSGSTLKFEYMFKDREYRLHITQKGIERLFQAAYLVSKYLPLDSIYIQGMVVWLYEDILKGVNAFSDRKSRTLEAPPSIIKIRPFHRDILRDDRLIIKGNEISFPESPHSDYPEGSYSMLDHFITQGDKSYLIPNEAFMFGKTVQYSKLSIWQTPHHLENSAQRMISQIKNT
ncbi:hypothetical protein [Desulfovibrio oxyclinae]|uniref:hypothetical protein n=1 Tax=Desulfovibrio oxyclinae TaxID=63560 RepID=UPI0012EA9CEB|nr:hypothetical protein [Desulfovibrio oxyclinae]